MAKSPGPDDEVCEMLTRAVCAMTGIQLDAGDQQIQRAARPQSAANCNLIQTDRLLSLLLYPEHYLGP
jgi:hypothetical protein